MTALRIRTALLAFAALATLVYAVEILVVRAALPHSPAPGVIAAAVAFDLVVGVPALFYLLCIRGRAPLARMAPVVLLSLVGASLVLPSTYAGIPATIRTLAIAAEVVLVVVLVRRGFRAMRTADRPGDLADSVRETVRSVVPLRRAADAAAYEAALFAYAAIGWRMRVAEDEGAFTIHRKIGYGGIAFALGLVSVVEMAVVHLLLHAWSPAVAWTLTALSAYGIVWLLGDTQAIRLRPMHADEDALRVRVGLRWSVDVPWDDVVAVTRPLRQSAADAGAGLLRATPIGEPRLVLDLAQPLTATGPYGFTRQVSRIGLTVDDEPRFLAAIAARTGLSPSA